MIVALTQVVANLFFATIVWLISLAVGKVSIVDRCWSLFFIIACIAAMVMSPGASFNIVFVMIPLLLWSIRLALHITIRSLGQPEDRRYVMLKERYGKNIKSWALWIVFWPQAILACFINWPLTMAVTNKNLPWSLAAVYIGLVIFTIGFGIESIADAQLLRFQRQRVDNEEVLDKGLWAYSRHPNYFGEAMVWWGFFIISVGINGNYFTVLSPMLMTFLLLRVSGVTMLDKVLKESKPKYEHYIKTTSAFFLWPPKRK